MRSFTIIIGTAALTIPGVAGAALPSNAINPNAPAIHGNEIFERAVDPNIYCGPAGICGWRDDVPMCCPSPPGKSTAYPRRNEKTPDTVVESNANAPATAMTDNEIVKRVEDCGDRGACGMGSYGVWCCPFPPGKNTAYPRSEKPAADKSNAPATAMHDKEIVKRVEDCGDRGACGMGSYGVWCCPFPPGKSSAYPRSDEKTTDTAVEANADSPSTAMHDNENPKRVSKDTVHPERNEKS
ncbi:MAG: hypothetical protein Q9221_001093 [Calogaya cf. arnoldii]